MEVPNSERDGTGHWQEQSFRDQKTEIRWGGGKERASIRVYDKCGGVKEGSGGGRQRKGGAQRPGKLRTKRGKKILEQPYQKFNKKRGEKKNHGKAEKVTQDLIRKSPVMPRGEGKKTQGGSTGREHIGSHRRERSRKF